MKYHETLSGEWKVCRASVEPCPFANSEHKEMTEKEAREENNKVRDELIELDKEKLDIKPYIAFYRLREEKAGRLSKEIQLNTNSDESKFNSPISQESFQHEFSQLLSKLDEKRVISLDVYDDCDLKELQEEVNQIHELSFDKSTNGIRQAAIYKVLSKVVDEKIDRGELLSLMPSQRLKQTKIILESAMNFIKSDEYASNPENFKRNYHAMSAVGEVYAIDMDSMDNYDFCFASSVYADKILERFVKQYE